MKSLLTGNKITGPMEHERFIGLFVIIKEII
jgi:hypothetical protein